MLLVPSRRLPELSLILGSGQTSRRTDGRSASRARRGGTLPYPAPTKVEPGHKVNPAHLAKSGILSTGRGEKQNGVCEERPRTRSGSQAIRRRCPNAPPGYGDSSGSDRPAIPEIPEQNKGSQVAAPRDAVEPRAANIAARKHRGASMHPCCQQRARDEESKSLGDGIAAPTGTLGAKEEITAPSAGHREPVLPAPKFGEGNPKTLAP